MKFGILALAFASLASFGADVVVPTVSSVTMTQDSGRKVTINYTLVDGPAVVTLDIQTNAPGGAWVSIGGQNISGGTIDRGVPRGDVNKIVESGSRTITWRPDVTWGDQTVSKDGARAVVTAWALDDTPDYLVVDLAPNATDRCRYYPSADFLPGGTGATNDLYRTGKMLLRKIRAKDVEWTMGSTFEEGRDATTEMAHKVVLDHNYYMGVFPVTQYQFEIFRSEMPGLTGQSYQYFAVHGMTRPKERVTYREMREDPAGAENQSYWYPNPPNENSWIGRLRARTALDFDLPSEAEWEYACRAGHGDGYWGNGGLIQTDEPNGRYSGNGGTFTDKTKTYLGPGGMYMVTESEVGPEYGTAIVGTYAPNDWGVYDMSGNVREFCLDWYKMDISSLNGAVCTDSSSGKRVVRGGFFEWDKDKVRPAARASAGPDGSWRDKNIGFRVMCRGGLN